MKIHYVTIFLLMVNYLCYGQEIDTIIDARDGQVYKIVKIGEQWWMAENLKYTGPTEPKKSRKFSGWCYQFINNNCETYGRLYTWTDAQKACPDGWHLPSIEEWTILFNQFGGEIRAGKELKVEGKSGFNAQLSGFRNSHSRFRRKGLSGIFWTSYIRYDQAGYFEFLYNSDQVYLNGNYKNYGFSVRCIKDQ